MPTDTNVILTQRSLVDIAEGELVAKLLADPHWRSRIIGLRGIRDDVVPYQGVELANFPGDPSGDIDVLLVPPGAPADSTTIQVKRVKVHDDTFRTETPNKLNEISKGARQANLLAKLGFAQVYYFVFVVVDSRVRNGGRLSYEGLTPSLRSKLDSAISVQGLDARVGLVHFELVQPLDDEPLGAGTFHGQLKRLATLIPQSAQVTSWVSDVVARHG